MRRTLVWLVVTLVALSSAILVTAASARPTAEDNVRLQVFLRDGNLMTTTRGLSFQIVVEVESSTGILQPVTIRTRLPDGLRWGTDAPDPGEGCTGTVDIVCATETRANEVGTVGAGYFWDLVAASPGFYEMTASVTTTEPDPDTSDNTHTFRFEVRAESGGGGGGGGGGGVASVSASAAKLSPAKPKAGSAVVATVRVTAQGAPVKPSRVTCAASIGRAKLEGVARAASGSASCTLRTPRSAKGKVLRGSVSLTARGSRFTKRFSARLG